MSTDQAFFAAYGATDSSGAGSHSRPQTGAAVSANRARNGHAIESQYSDGAWYRIDQHHRDQGASPAPHLAKIQHKQPLPPVETLSVDTCTWDSMPEWQNSSVVISSSMPANEPTVAAAPAELPKHTQAAVSSEPHMAADERADEQDSSQPPTRDESPADLRGPWKAQWEVDGFAWPEELLRLQAEQMDYFRYAGEKLRDASREGLKTMAVVATREQEGCTTMALCLALAASAAGARVALLDANLRRPELGEKLGLDFSSGWQESLTGNGSLADAAVLGLDSNLTVLPLSGTHPLPEPNDRRIGAVLRAAAAAFDLLIIDAGVAPANDGSLFGHVADCPVNAALVVRDLRRTSEAETLATAQRLKALGIDAIGIAENFLPPSDRQVAAA